MAMKADSDEDWCDVETAAKTGATKFDVTKIGAT